ncbi:34911_t:CDS:2 [Gigaspora margarita]|uniref:34911_t:CDS:1 n=1 Tax=Gigaspora margarita TaxID=4874 RepID=A0ABN7W4U6_GIGMA|nr:34911_t:CDS:2 [Gigaspora margarita]
MQEIFCPITSHLQVSTSSSSLQTAIITIAQLSENLEEFYPNASNCRDKKRKALEDQNEVIRYNQPGRPSLLVQHPDLLDNIYNSIEYRAADVHRQTYHYPAWVAITRVSYNETKEHQDEHYCLALVKREKQFAKTFLFAEPVRVSDHDFPCEYDQKLYTEALKVDGCIKPIWVLLVNGGPDENSRHLKNINSYCKFFKKFDLDYLIVCTHASEQSKYNPVERAIATLSGKLARITLPIDYFGKHLDSQGKVINSDLAKNNFRYASEALYKIWYHDHIFGKKVNTTYIDKAIDPFVDLEFVKEQEKKEKRLRIT